MILTAIGMKKYLYYKGIDLYFLFDIDDVTNLNNFELKYFNHNQNFIDDLDNTLP